jgi:hypothetical protein
MVETEKWSGHERVRWRELLRDRRSTKGGMGTLDEVIGSSGRIFLDNMRIVV